MILNSHRQDKALKLIAKPELQDASGYAMHVDISWKKVSAPAVKLIKIYRSEDGRNFNAVGVQYPFISRFADYAGETGKKYWYYISYLDADYNESEKSNVLEASTRPMTDEELLTMVQASLLRILLGRLRKPAPEWQGKILPRQTQYDCQWCQRIWNHGSDCRN